MRSERVQRGVLDCPDNFISVVYVDKYKAPYFFLWLGFGICSTFAVNIRLLLFVIKNTYMRARTLTILIKWK